MASTPTPSPPAGQTPTGTLGETAPVLAPANSAELQAFYYFGSSITLVSSLFVIFSYLKFRACRQHPSSLIFWRSVSDVAFSLQFIILFSDTEGRNHCNVFSFLFQFFLLSSQSWYAMNAVDLLRSMRNPFTDPKANIPAYHVFVWGMSAVTSIAIDTSNHVAYRPDMQLCWTSVASNGVFNYVNWLTFFIPTLIYYLTSIATIIYAGIRLKKGLDETFATRQIVLHNGIRYVAGFCAYWTFAGIIYGIINVHSNDYETTDGSTITGPSSSDLPLYATFAVTIAFRGVVDVVIWIYNQRVLVIYRKWWRDEPHSDPADIGLNETDINRALRREVLIFSTTGIALAVDRANAVPFSAVLPTIEQYPMSLDADDPRNMHSVVRINVHREDFGGPAKVLQRINSGHGNSPHPGSGTASSSGSGWNSPGKNSGGGGGGGGGNEGSGAYPARSASPADNVTAADFEASSARERSVSTLLGDKESVPFLDYAPQVFRFLRATYGLDEGSYKKSVQGQTEAMIEKFTEGGRSGSFFYFSEDGKYLVKTLTSDEASFLVKWMPRYVGYMSNQRNTLLSRFCGFHAITLYNLTIYFKVMQSVFQTPRKIHERYDLKGSYVDRHASAERKKSRRTAAGAAAAASAFRNVVYKDNDLNRTVRLSEGDRDLFLHQLRKDAYFLRDSNIMDYSLLLGVHHTSHVVPLMSPVHSPVGSHKTSVADDSQQNAAATSQEQIMLTPGGNNHTSVIAAAAAAAGSGPSSLGNSSHQIVSGLGARSVSSTSPFPVSASGMGTAHSRGPSSMHGHASTGLFTKDDGGVQAAIIEGPGIYFFGLIDILQEYDTSKKLERLAKVYLRCKDGLGISAMSPVPYADRFLRFMANMTREPEQRREVFDAESEPVSLGGSRQDRTGLASASRPAGAVLPSAHMSEQKEAEAYVGTDSDLEAASGADTAAQRLTGIKDKLLLQNGSSDADADHMTPATSIHSDNVHRQSAAGFEDVAHTIQQAHAGAGVASVAPDYSLTSSSSLSTSHTFGVQPQARSDPTVSGLAGLELREASQMSSNFGHGHLIAMETESNASSSKFRSI